MAVPVVHLRPRGRARRGPRRLDHPGRDRRQLLAGHDPRASATILQIDQFKIDLPIVAAFLTLIGFSVNDTIVIFDRIREIKGKTPHLTNKMVNDAINQTLSRTILTSFTAWLVVVILYFFGGEGLHGFAFALVVGFLSGTYSTVYIATPILIDLIGTKTEPPKPRPASNWPAVDAESSGEWRLGRSSLAPSRSTGLTRLIASVGGLMAAPDRRRG